jgi:hypothetical protein
MAAAPATATEAAATTTAAAAPSRLAFAGFVDGERAAVERLTMQLGNGRLSIFFAGELDEREPARLTGHTIGHDTDADDFAPTGGACLTKPTFVRVIREISDVNASAHSFAPECLQKKISCVNSRERSIAVHRNGGRL